MRIKFKRSEGSLHSIPAKGLDAAVSRFQLHCPLFELHCQFQKPVRDVPICGLPGQTPAARGLYPEIFGLVSRVVWILGHEPVNATVDNIIPWVAPKDEQPYGKDGTPKRMLPAIQPRG